MGQHLQVKETADNENPKPSPRWHHALRSAFARICRSPSTLRKGEVTVWQ